MSESMAEELAAKECESFANDVHGTSTLIGFPIERYEKPCSSVLHRRCRLGILDSSRWSTGVSQRFRLETLVSNQGCRKWDDEVQVWQEVMVVEAEGG